MTMPEFNPHLTLLSDPGHGWLRVPLVEIVALEIEGQISPYSFIQGQHAFLEEDCDCPRYLQARASRGIPPPVIEGQFVERFVRPGLRFRDPALDTAFWNKWRR
jgi:hypothetical protein